MKLILVLLTMSLFGFSPDTSKNGKPGYNREEKKSTTIKESVSYRDQIEVFRSLGYKFADGVTKDMILKDVYEMSWKEETEKYIENNPYSVLYYCFGGRDPKVPGFNYSDKCIWFDLEFFDPSSQYKWFMERMGVITNGEIQFQEIKILVDDDNYEWISFKVNGQQKRWKLEKKGYIAEYVQRFSYLPGELNTKGRYTIFDDGSQQWVIDYATEEEQVEFNQKTGLKRKWLGEGNNFSEPEE